MEDIKTQSAAKAAPPAPAAPSKVPSAQDMANAFFQAMAANASKGEEAAAPAAASAPAPAEANVLRPKSKRKAAEPSEAVSDKKPKAE